MKWQQRVSCRNGSKLLSRSYAHLLVVALLVVGWMKRLWFTSASDMRTVLCHGSDDAGVQRHPRATLA